MENKYDISSFVNVVTEQAMKKEIVKRFKLRRKEFAVTQKDLAIRSGVSYASFRRFESTGEISLYSLLSISSVIGCLEDFYCLFKNPIVKDIRR